MNQKRVDKSPTETFEGRRIAGRAANMQAQDELSFFFIGTTLMVIRKVFREKSVKISQSVSKTQ